LAQDKPGAQLPSRWVIAAWVRDAGPRSADRGPAFSCHRVYSLFSLL
jgi:hypothetical protein